MALPSDASLQSAATLLGVYYLCAVALNVGSAWLAWRRARSIGRAAAWGVMAAMFGLLAARSLAGVPPEMPDWAKTAIDAALGPVSFTLGSLGVLVALFVGRRFFVKPWVAWGVFNASLAFLGLSFTDPEFAQIVLRPDNVPIVAMVYLLGFFVWLGASQAVANDQRRRRAQEPVEKDYRETALVWPDLVYIELIAMVIVTAGLIVWSLTVPAPLEQPANPAITPNPSKAPWYFVGLQEMLVYFDPAIAGVILPSLIILGLAAIPYLDFNPKGSGYYTIDERPCTYVTFLFGLLQLWVVLILIGTFFRGPNWDFYGLYGPRDTGSLSQSAVELRKLSEVLWIDVLRSTSPQVPADSGAVVRLGYVVWREIAGSAAIALYFVCLPVLLSRTLFRGYRWQMGPARYWIMVLLLLMMLALPLKMLLRWTADLSYVVSMPEYYFNF